MAVQTTITEVTVDRIFNKKGFKNLNCWILAFSKDYPTRDVVWDDSQGEPPPQGTQVWAELHPTTRSDYYVQRGDLLAGMADGNEMPWQVNWAMKSWTVEKPQTAEEAIFGPPTTPNTQQQVKPLSEGVSVLNKPTFIDANMRWKVEQMAVNDREAVRMVISHGEMEGGNTYALMEDVLRESALLADHFNSRLEARLGLINEEPASPLVEAAKQMGAEVVKVEKTATPDIPIMKTEDDVKKYVVERQKTEPQKWSREACSRVVKEAGFEESKDYISATGNTAQGLVNLLVEKLDKSW